MAPITGAMTSVITQRRIVEDNEAFMFPDRHSRALCTTTATIAQEHSADGDTHQAE